MGGPPCRHIMGKLSLGSSMGNWRGRYDQPMLVEGPPPNVGRAAKIHAMYGTTAEKVSGRLANNRPGLLGNDWRLGVGSFLTLDFKDLDFTARSGGAIVQSEKVRQRIITRLGFEPIVAIPCAVRDVGAPRDTWMVDLGGHGIPDTFLQASDLETNMMLEGFGEIGLTTSNPRRRLIIDNDIVNAHVKKEWLMAWKGALVDGPTIKIERINLPDSIRYLDHLADNIFISPDARLRAVDLTVGYRIKLPARVQISGLWDLEQDFGRGVHRMIQLILFGKNPGEAGVAFWRRGSYDGQMYPMAIDRPHLCTVKLERLWAWIQRPEGWHELTRTT